VILVFAIFILIIESALSSVGLGEKSHCGNHRYSPLDCWLWNLEVAIPDQTFDESIFRLSVVEMICTHFEVASIQSTFIPSTTAPQKYPSVDLSVAGISASCTGKYKTTGLSGSLSASLSQSPSTPEALQISLEFETGYLHKLRMATAVSAKQCGANLECNDITFSGSVSAKVINLFKRSIRNYISKAVSTQLCPVLKLTADKQLTDLIKKVDEYLMGLISQKDSEVAVIASERQLQSNSYDLFTWRRDAPLLWKTLDFFNYILNRYLNHGLFLDFLSLLKLDHDLPDYDCGFFYHGVNGFLRDLTGDGSMEFDLPSSLSSLTNFSFVIPKYAAMSIELKHIRIEGIDGFKKLTVLKPSIQETFWTEVSTTEGLNLTTMVEIQVSTIPGGAFQGDTLLETLNVSIDTSSLNVSSSVKLNMEKSRFATTRFSHVISAFNGSEVDLACSIFPIESFAIESLSAMASFEVLSFTPKESDGRSLEKDIDAVLNNFLRLFIHEYGNLVTLSFSGLLDGPIRDAATKTAKRYLHKLITDNHASGSLCSNTSRTLSSSDYIDFSDINILRKLDTYLNDTGTILNVNNFLECISGVLNSQLNSAKPKIAFEGDSLELRRLEIENSGTVQRLELLSPSTDYHLFNSFNWGRCPRNTSFADVNTNCAGPRFIAEIEIDLPRANMSAAINLTSSIGSFQSSTSAFILYDMNRLRNLTYADVMSQDVCIISPLDEATIFASPQVFEKLFFGLAAEVKGANGSLFVLDLNSSTYEQSISVFKSASSWFQMFIGEYINRSLSHSMSIGKSKCDGSLQTTSNDMKNQERTINFLIVINYLLPIYILMHIMYVVIKLRMPQRERSEDVGLVNENSLSIPLSVLREKNSSLMTKEIINSGFRHTFPVFVIGIISLLFWSNLSVGASVDLSISTDQAADVIRLPSLFIFSLGNTVDQMYRSGIYSLLVVVVVFSGIWPYMKCLLMLWAWFVPQSRLSKKTRGRLLFAIDALSKFSLVDTYVLVVMMVSFRLHLSLFLETIFVDVFVNPVFGFYGFLLATILSLIAGRCELHAHRSYERSEQESNDESKETILSHEYRLGGQRLRFSTLFKQVIISFIAVVILLLCIGCFLKSFTFEFGGLASAMLGDEKKQNYSLISIGSAISRSVEDPDGPGIMFLQVVYFFFAIIMPFLCLLLLLVLLLIPMKREDQKTWLAATEVANSWSAIEVFALSIVVALFQLSTFASFIVGDKCDAINQIIADQFDEELNGDDTCFSIHAYVSWSALFLVLGAAFNSFVVSSLLEIAQIAVEERAEPANDSQPTVEEERNNSRVIKYLEISPVGRFFLVSTREPAGEEAISIQINNDD